ncbi:MAG: hypothetical protein CMP56_03550 [Flavobacteriales bacterium]|jgi:hypothetical protein|nr:hypothetical protein [Flavobacteriales bacterium]|tara:strand:+ start:40 stop:288 length:249 start_codon:yes stop_codon:yes gene_type:complete
MAEEKTSNCGSKSNNCYAIIALCVSFLAIGMLLGNWMGKCTKTKTYYDTKKCQSYSVDGKAGSTCNWSKYDKKECKTDSTKN